MPTETIVFEGLGADTTTCETVQTADVSETTDTRTAAQIEQDRIFDLIDSCITRKLLHH